ncbi:hypothetical protein JCM24511_01562 [Saitozyma sp. JCM 24511]|nr:hypothetical protein JCM24511_01562 [Saitozyma sp. JCM 24511]
MPSSTSSVAKGERLHTLMNTLVALPTFVAMGYSLSYLGGVLSFSPFYHLFPQLDTSTTTGSLKSHNTLNQGAVNASLNLGALAGCLSCIYLGNRLGRRKTTFLGSAIVVLGTVLMCAAFSLPQLCVGRVLIGIGLGMMSSTVPVWQSESSKTHKRGVHVIIDGVYIALGIAVCAWTTYGFWRADSQSGWKWRIPGIIPGALALVVACSCLFFPESPRWLVLKGRVEDARLVFATVLDRPPSSEEVEEQLVLSAQIIDVAGESASLSMLFKYGREKMLYRLLLAVSAQFYSQMNGAGLITYYSNQLFATIGLDTNTSKILAASSLTFKWLCTFIAFYTVEMAGRRLLFMISGAGMAVCMASLAICGALTSPDRLGPAYAAIAFVFLFVVFLPIGYLGINFLYCQEVISTRYRAPASGISTATHWTSAFVVAFATPFGFNSLGWKYYLIWASLSASIVPVVWLLYPETTGLSMEEVDKVFVETASPLTARRDAVRAGAGAGVGAAKRRAMTAPMSSGPGYNDEKKGTVTEVEKV